MTDTHFGVKNNSISFLDSQEKIFKQLNRYLTDLKDTGKRIDIIHLGDLFDSRSTISTLVQWRVSNIFNYIYKSLVEVNENNRIIFVAGNHDFHSQQSDTVCTIDVVMRPLLHQYPQTKYVISEAWRDGEDVYVPWFVWEDVDRCKEATSTAGIKNVFTHAELREFGWNNIKRPWMKDLKVYAGHIHQYKVYNDQAYNLAPPYSIDFGDATTNDTKGMWIIDDDGELILIPNSCSIQFHNIRNDEIFNIEDLDKKIERGDYFNIYINTFNQLNETYINCIKKLTSEVKHINIIPISDVIESTDTNIEFSVDGVLRDMFVEDEGEGLVEYFDLIAEKVKVNK